MEYIAANEAGKEMLWLKQFLQELGLKQDGYVVNCDSQSAIDLSKNSMYHSHSKHIEVRYNWLRLVVEQQLFELEKIHTDENSVDMLTKVMSREKLKLLCRVGRHEFYLKSWVEDLLHSGLEGEIVGCVAPSGSSPLACHSCQSSFMSLSSQAPKVSFLV